MTAITLFFAIAVTNLQFQDIVTPYFDSHFFSIGEIRMWIELPQKKGDTIMSYLGKHEITILRLKQVQGRTGLSRSTIYDRMGKGTFPCSVSLGARAVGWLESEIDEWILKCVENRILYRGYGKNGEVKVITTENSSRHTN